MRIWHQSFTDLDRVPLYRRTLEAHGAAVLDAGDTVAVHGLRPGTYGDDFVPIDAIRHRYLEFLNEAQICEAALAAERAGYDAMAIGCFYDPALRMARSLVEIPVVGLSETCMLVACSLGSKFALVALNEDQRVQHEELAVAYGLERRMAGVVPMDPPIDEYVLEDEGEGAQAIEDGFRRACARAMAQGAEVIIPGDGVLNEFVYRRGLLQVEGATVMDSLGVLFRYAAFMAGTQAAMGLKVSRVRHYAMPGAGMLAHARAVAGAAALDESDFSGGPARQLPTPHP
ncbi:aspartate/glutamate racemase family protein [Propylenella binzhouense]|uniref:Racemase n=1 Tax=Propylenella binzhouense TaxID=2555902 RepID=A0A964WRT2_9HYPH|nr:aspartate/glutamate racemase family protein [Propylenella binzhouense]MYZ46248.1 racemase [Propylenella binzhouense]